DRIGEGRRVAFAADNQIHPPLPGSTGLRIRSVKGRLLGLIQTEMFDVADDADDRNPVYLLVSRPADALADGILFPEKAARQTLIDDPDQWRVLIVTRCKVAP